jgi:hypothetical protein
MSAHGRKGGLLVEILMIVIGINVALWFEGWFEDLRDAEMEAQYLADLRDDLRADIRNLDDLIQYNADKADKIGGIIKRLDHLGELSSEEQTAVIFAPSSYGFFQPSNFTYRSMQESGDFRLLSDASIKKLILQLNRNHGDIAVLQGNFLQALDDGYIPLMMSNFDILNSRVVNTSLFDNVAFRNFFSYTEQDTQAMLRAYEIARQRSGDLLAEIDAELGDD